MHFSVGKDINMMKPLRFSYKGALLCYQVLMCLFLIQRLELWRIAALHSLKM